jgi:cytochrome c oxidase subunit 1
MLLFAICFLPHMLIWIHHRFVLGLNPFVGRVILIIILLILFIFVFKWIRWLNRHWFTKNNNEPIVLFAIGGTCLIISGIIFRTESVDIHLHDTLYIISYYVLALCISFVFGIFSFIYYIFYKIFRRNLSIKLSRLHFWITFIGLNLLLGTRGANRVIWGTYHYIDNSGWAYYNLIQFYNKYVLVMVILILIAQFLFLVNILYSLLNKKEGT